jgi:hypothetical protein
MTKQNELIPPRFTSPAELTAVAVAAHKAGDVRLERAAKRELREQFGMRISFLREPREVTNAS